MILTEKNRIEAFTKKGWWGEDTLYSLFKDALTSCGDQEALVDPENRKDITGDLPKRLSFNWFCLTILHFILTYYDKYSAIIILTFK